MKLSHINLLVLTLGILLLFSTNAGAEHVFKTDGSIIEGRITADTADSIVVLTSRGYSVKIRRSSILTLFSFIILRPTVS